MEKGVSIIAGVLFLAITITAAVLIYNATYPVIKKMQAAAAIEKMREAFSELDKIIQEVASEGKGSKRTVYLKVDPGKITINETKDTIIWEYDTDAPVISPRSYQVYGSLIVGSNLDVNASTTTYHSKPAYIVENQHLKAYFKRWGSPSNKTTFNTSTILMGIYSKDLSEWFSNTGLLEISMDNETGSNQGVGYTTINKLGDNLPYAIVTMHVNSTNVNYHVNFTLESGADFLIIEAALNATT